MTETAGATGLNHGAPMSKFSGLTVGTADRVFRVVLLHPATGAPIPVAGVMDGDKPAVAYVDVISSDSEVARAYEHDRANARLRAPRPVRPNAAEITANVAGLYARLSRRWLLATLDGQPLDVPFSIANAEELFSLPEAAWIREQIDAAVVNRSNFLPPAAG